ncbi:hypothetical protein WH47_09090, partial [Habropoda laboriosa]
KANFPYCIGAVDGKHIRNKKPPKSGSTYVSIGSYGKDCESSIYKRTTLWEKLTEDNLDIPKSRSFDEHSETNILFVFIRTEGFTLHTKIRLYGGTHLDKKKRIFNYCFSILANKRRICHRPIDVN